MTRREDITKLLEEHEWTADAIAQRLDIDKRTVQDDMEHIFKSVKAEGKKLVIKPAMCTLCKFIFKERMKQPSKCPECRKEAIEGPWFRIK